MRGMKVVKRIFQIAAGLWLLAMIVLGAGTAWLQNNPETVTAAVEDAVGLEQVDTRHARSVGRARAEAWERAYDNGWGEGQALPENATLESGGWAD